MSSLITLPVSLIITKIFQSLRHTNEDELVIQNRRKTDDGLPIRDTDVQKIQCSGLELYDSITMNEGMYF